MSINEDSIEQDGRGGWEPNEMRMEGREVDFGCSSGCQCEVGAAERCLCADTESRTITGERRSNFSDRFFYKKKIHL